MNIYRQPLASNIFVAQATFPVKLIDPYAGLVPFIPINLLGLAIITNVSEDFTVTHESVELMLVSEVFVCELSERMQ